MLVQKQEPTRLIKDEKEALKGMRDAKMGNYPPMFPSESYCIGYSHEVDRQERESHRAKSHNYGPFSSGYF